MYLYNVEIESVTISLSDPIQGAMVGSPQVINCIVSTVSGVESSSVMIRWLGPGGVSIISDSRMTINPTTSSGNNYTSSLQFTYLMEGDEGTYTCNGVAQGVGRSQSVELQSLTSKLFACTYLHMYLFFNFVLSYGINILATNLLILILNALAKLAHVFGSLYVSSAY